LHTFVALPDAARSNAPGSRFRGNAADVLLLRLQELVMESAGNILNAFNRMQSAADGVQRAVQGCPLAGSSR
jgi:hypothetical protein